MRRRIFWSGVVLSLLLSAILVILTEFAIISSVKRQLSLSTSLKLERLTTMLNNTDDAEELLDKTLSDLKIILVSENGNKIFDSFAPFYRQEDYSKMPEIKESIKKGSGAYIQKRANYYLFSSAKKLKNGNVLCVIERSFIINEIRSKMYLYLILLFILLLFLASGTSKHLTDKLIDGVNAIDIDNPVDTCNFEEFLPFVRSISSKQNELKDKISLMEKRKIDISVIFNALGEGFIMLDKRMNIISINDSACALLGTTAEKAEGKPFQAINRQKEIMQLLFNLEHQDSTFAIVPLGKRNYRIAASVMDSDEKGIVFLFTDLTDKLENENLRKRFTANVSHELRTPLTTISGYTEMLVNGMVRKKDELSFFKRINKEANRMLKLVDDILRLSRMDEGKISSDMEPVKLSDIIDNCIESLRPIASKRNISLESSCDDCEILGNPTLIGEIIFNLIDNAVKYNKINGSVKVNLYREGAKCILTVEDTGIGIEEGKQNQIFERFYRTDKSRSKDKGGTGLGLSIVKHAAEYHNAKLDVKSELGKGTTMKVIFWCDPKNTSEQII